jgi:serine/threonine protein kinase
VGAQNMRTSQKAQSELVLENAFFTLATEEPTGGDVRRMLRLSSTGGQIRAGAAQILPACAELSTVLHDDAKSVIVEQFAGVSLKQRVAHGSLSQAEALTVLRGVATALEQMHRLGLVHCTLRPDSILVDGLFRVRVIDWALEWQEPNVAQMQELFRSAAPELLLGEARGPRTDQFAFGALAHWLLFDAMPFGGATAAQNLLSIMAGVWNIENDSDAELEAFDRVFSPDPTQRFLSCSHFLEMLERELAGGTAATVPAQTGSSSPGLIIPASNGESAGTRWQTWGVGATIVCAVLAFFFGAMSWWTQREIAHLQAITASAADATTAAISENGRMKVCNSSTHMVLIRDLAVAYWSPERRLQVFESSAAVRQGWTVSPSSEQSLSWNPRQSDATNAAGQQPSWDGSVLFYYLRLEQEGKEYMLSGTWDNAGHGCLAIASQ